jgi:hypothetical protein
MSELPFDLAQPPPDKLHVIANDEPPPDLEAIKERIAGRVRSDSRQHRRLTPEQDIMAVARELERPELSSLLAAMATENRYGDVKAVVAPSGRVYLFSEKHLIALEAAELGRIEEARVAIVERIRTDSSRVVLTAMRDLEPLFPFPEPERREALLAEIRADPRFQDIQVVTGPVGEVYLHSDRFVSGNYGAIMMRARAKDASWAIAELVRERSRIMPAPTRTTVFHDPVFGIDPSALDTVIEELLHRSGFEDVKRIVHPKTGATYLYSSRHLDEARAIDIMDWEEVGARRNP